MKEQAMLLRLIANDNIALEVGRKAVEDELIDWRDRRLSQMTRGNGCVVREVDGTPSHIIRFGPETAIRIGLLAIADHLESKG